MPPHPLTNLEIQKYHKNEPRFNGVSFRYNLSKIKDGAYIINLDEYFDIESHWVALYARNNNSVTNFQKKLKNLSIVLCPLLRKTKT